MGNFGIEGRVGQLHRIASVPIGLPHDALGEGNVGHELAVWRERDILGGNASEPGLELMGLRVKANQFAPQDDTLGKYLRPVFAGDGRVPADRA